MRRRPPRPTRARSTRPSVELMERRTLLATFVVTDTNDDTNPGSLRYAITQSNATTGPNVIDFDIPGSGFQTITVTGSPLPAITTPVTIDGTSQPGYAGKPLIVLLRGVIHQVTDGLDVDGGGSTIEGLTINGFDGSGIVLSDAGDNLITRDFLGSDPTGENYTDKPFNSYAGVLVQAGSDNNTISGNLISGNRITGIALDGSNIAGGVTSGNLIVGNLIGTDATGTRVLSPYPADQQILLKDDVLTTIGGTTAGARNVIVGSQYSVALVNLVDSDVPLIEGNYLGTDATGEVPLGDFGTDISITGTSSGVTIGGSVAGAGNVIASAGTNVNRANVAAGISATESGAGLTIQGNKIGTDGAGMAALRNTGDGIDLAGPTGVTIGGSVAGAGNVISGNAGNGITVNTPGVVIQGNKIGVAIDGMTPLGNSGDGIDAQAQGVAIGGLLPGQGNVIASNGSTSGSVGVRVDANNVSILSNSIDANLAGGISLNAAKDANNGQAAPVLTAAVSLGGMSTITGSLTTPNGTYTLQFFDSPTLDPGGIAEGRTLLATETLTVSGGSMAFTYTLPVTIGPSDFITATATDSAGDTSAFSDSPPPIPTPSLTAMASSSSVPAGQVVTDTFTITNSGTVIGDSGVVFTDVISSGVSFVSGMTSGGASVTLTNGVATATIGTIAPGQSVTVTIALLTSGASIPSFTNTGQITATVPMVAAGSVTAPVTTIVTQEAPTLRVSASATRVPAGVIVTDTFTLTNPDTVVGDSGVVFTDPIPSGVSFASGMTSTGAAVTLANGVATANIGAIAPGQSVTVAIALLTSKASIPSFTNTGQIAATRPMIGTGAVTASATTTVVQGTDLVAAVSTPSATTTGQITFTASVYNLGPIPAQGVSLVDTFTLPAGAKVVSESVQQGTAQVSGNVVTASIGTLAVNSSVVLTVVVATTSGGVFTQSALAGSSTPDPTTGNNTATFTSTVLVQDSIRLTPSANHVAPGKPLTLDAQVSVPTGFPAATLSVTFLDGSTPIGTVTLDASGHASLVDSRLAKGPHSITASYAGDPNYPAVTSSTTPVRVGYRTPGDYDGDGKADVAIYDQTTSTFLINKSGGGSIVQPFGNATHINIAIPGDFDGDGRTDLAIYDQTASTYYILESGGGAIIQPFGNSTHTNIPIAGDYDGDNKTDLAIYDQTASTFYILKSGGGAIVQPFGNSTHTNIPVPGDYDGDGRTDLAIYDQTAATFYILKSGGGAIVQPFGSVGHANVPLAGDYDGDGKTDLAIDDPVASMFFVRESEGGAIVQHFGNPAVTNIPLVVDFDGDGKTDLAIDDETDAVIFVQESGGGSIVMPFGTKKHRDIPL